MNKILTLVAASFIASAGVSSHALAQGASGGVGTGAEVTSPGASGFAPGQNRMGGSAAPQAPGMQMQNQGGAATDYAPGQRMQTMDHNSALTTGALGQPTFGTVVSTIRAGQFDLSEVSSDTEVEIVRINDLPGADSAALDNALNDNEDRITELRSDLEGLELSALEDEDIEMNDVVAVRTETNGKLTIFVR